MPFFATTALAAELPVANLKEGLLRLAAALEALKPSAWMATSTPALEAVAFALKVVVKDQGLPGLHGAVQKVDSVSWRSRQCG